MQPEHSQGSERAVIYVEQSQFKPLDNTHSIQEQVNTSQVSCAEGVYVLSEDQIYMVVREGTLHALPSEKNQRRSFDNALEIVGNAQSEQQN